MTATAVAALLLGAGSALPAHARSAQARSAANAQVSIRAIRSAVRQRTTASATARATTVPTTLPIAAPPTTPVSDVIDGAQSQRLQQALDRWTLTESGLGSMTVSLRIGGRSWAGSARADGAAGPDPAAVYRVMSITKTFTAALVLRAVEAGRLTLDGPLPRLDAVPAPMPEGLTIRRLLGHRSGLVDYSEAPGYQADQPITPERAVELSLHAAPTSAPGSTTKYANSNYLLLGLLLQQVEHRSYPDLVADLATSVGLANTYVDPPDRLGWAGFSSGGIMSSVTDIARWGDALFTPGRVVSPEVLALMSTTGELEGGLGLWGVCPCTDGASGLARFTAIGHHTVAGGLFRFPQSGLTLVMRAAPDGGDTKGRAVALAHQLLTALTG